MFSEQGHLGKPDEGQQHMRIKTGLLEVLLSLFL